MRFPVQRTLAQKFIWPLIFGWFALHAIIILWMLKDFETSLRSSIESRGELIANAVNYGADTVSEIGELQRIVSALGAEKDVKIIIVAAGKSPRVVVSNAQQYIGKLVSNFDSEMAVDINTVIKNRKTLIHHYKSKQLSEIALPLTLAQQEVAYGALANGVVMVHLDTAEIRAEQWRRGQQLFAVMLLVSTIGAVFVWWLLKIYVLRATNAMTAAISARSEGDRRIRSKIYGDDEMAWLSQRLNGMFDELEQEESERIKVENNLRRLNQFKEALLNSAGVSIIVTDLNGVIKVFNPVAEQLLGYCSDEVVDFGTPAMFHDVNEVLARGRVISNELGKTIEPGFEVFVAIAREKNQTDTNEWTYVHKSGKRIPVLLTVTCLRDDAGELTGYIGIAHDITEQKRIDNEMRELTLAAQKATEAKSEFLAIMSHEIRTPMNGVIGMTNLLQKTQLDQKQKKLVESIHFSGEVLMAIINDILDFSKIDADKMGLEKVPFSVSKLFDQAYQVYSAAAEKKEIKLVLNKPASDSVLVGDPIRLTQIVNNLISNAIKFTEQGSVIVCVAVESLDEDNKILQFSVKDTGVGMTTKQQSKLFQPFTQADSSTTRQYGGTGLGLVICKNLVLLMGGDIFLNSKRNFGTEFVVRVPLSCAHGKIAEDLMSNTAIFNADSNIQLFRGNPITILLVDDVLINQEVACGILEEAGCKVRVAGNGFKAIEIYQNYHSEIDVILMDCLMPEMDGYETTQKIRVFEQESHKRTPIIALTASALAETREKCMASGMDDFVSKPFNEMELLRKIREVVGLKVSIPEPAPSLELTLQSAMDDCVDHDVLGQLFRRFGNDKGKMLLGKFIASMEEFSANLNKAFVDGDNETMHRMVHNLKSSCGNVGATQARIMAAELEKNIDDCEGVFSNKELVDLLIGEIAKAKQQIVNHRSFS